MKSWTVPFAYGVERLEPNRPPLVTALKAAIFQLVPCWPDHWSMASCICVASYTSPMSTLPAAHASASVPRMGPEVMTGEHIRTRFCADAIDRDIACTSLRLRPGQKYGSTRVPSASGVQENELWPDAATIGFSHSPSKLIT